MYCLTLTHLDARLLAEDDNWYQSSTSGSQEGHILISVCVSSGEGGPGVVCVCFSGESNR